MKDATSGKRVKTEAGYNSVHISNLIVVGNSSAEYTYTAEKDMNTKNFAPSAIMIRPAA